MRILFVNARASAQGGIEANVRDSARALAARGHAVALAHEDSQPDPAFRAAFEALFPLGRAPRVALAAAARAFRPGVVYLHKVEDASRLGLQDLGAPLVRMVHDHDLYCQRRHRYELLTGDVCTRPASLVGCVRCGALVERRRGGPLGLGWRPIWERLSDLAATRRMDRVLVASRAMAAELDRNRIPPDRVRLVPLGVPWADPPARRADRRPPLRALFVGQVLRTKGLDLLLRALARCRPPWRLSVVGTGPQEAEFRGVARDLGIADAVAWHGRLAPEDVTRTMAAADILVVPSYWPEPFGLVGVEGMRAGLPVVGFEAGGIPDWLEHGVTGLLVPPADVAALAEALDRLFADPDARRRFGDAGRAAFEARFTEDRYVERLLGALEEVAA